MCYFVVFLYALKEPVCKHFVVSRPFFRINKTSKSPFDLKYMHS